jgi:hypothetical protein
MEFKVTLRQGQKTFVEYVESDNWRDVLEFYKRISTAKVVKIEQIVYKSSDDFVPDDGNYWSLVKVIARSNNGYARQFVFHNVKLSIDQRDLSELVRQYLKVAGRPIEGLVTVLWKR